MSGVPSRVVTLLELQGQARVVRYLRERARGLYKVTEAMKPESDADRDFQRAHSLKALSLIEAASMVQDGIARSVSEHFKQDGKRYTVCPADGCLLEIHGHGECPSPCHNDHIDECLWCNQTLRVGVAG